MKLAALALIILSTFGLTTACGGGTLGSATQATTGSASVTPSPSVSPTVPSPTVTVGATSVTEAPETATVSPPPPTPVVSPQATAAPTQTARETRVVTLADNGTSIRLAPEQSFLLKLGEEFDWSLTIGDQSIIRRVPNVLVVRGAQGLFMAHSVGTTELEAQGDPTCRKATPACAAPSLLFRVTVLVGG